ncbi:MAG TPA: glucoamylase family protein, partial [Terriglobia bacterium]|nr:glucoamylase family protein [Terriglobia bacterium]
AETNLCHFRRACLLRSPSVIAPASPPTGHDATLLHRPARCASHIAHELGKQFPDYSDDLWGITASDSPRGYVVWGGPPAIGPINGTVVPCATGGSLPFQPEAALRVLRNMRAVYGFDAWSKYGLTNQSSSAAAGT